MSKDFYHMQCHVYLQRIITPSAANYCCLYKIMDSIKQEHNITVLLNWSTK